MCRQWQPSGPEGVGVAGGAPAPADVVPLEVPVGEAMELGLWELDRRAEAAYRPAWAAEEQRRACELAAAATATAATTSPCSACPPSWPRSSGGTARALSLLRQHRRSERP